MNWGSPAEFFAMGGYALYVWGSFGVTALAMVLEVMMVRHRRQAVIKSLRREAFAHREENQ